MSWKINELDKAKTEQSIANEEIRLDHCHEEVMKLTNEVDMLHSNYEQKYNSLCERIDKIKKSIESGEQFIEECRTHLDNAKTEQSIANEEIRLDHCHEEVIKLINEADRLRFNYEQKYNSSCEQIDKIKKSIESGERFIEDCNNHLKDFENVEIKN